MKEEVWKYIPGTKHKYKASSIGKIMECFTDYAKGKVLNQTKASEYPTVRITKNGKKRYYMAHRLVAEAFLPNPNKLPLVNHKNKNKFDNRVENLEWCTSKQNILHARTHANMVMLGSKEGAFASKVIPQIKELVPFERTEPREKGKLRKRIKVIVPKDFVPHRKHGVFEKGTKPTTQLMIARTPGIVNGIFRPFSVFNK